MRSRNSTFWRGSITDSNSKATGDETEAAGIHRLVATGYTESVPFGDNDKYDLVVDDGG